MSLEDYRGRRSSGRPGGGGNECFDFQKGNCQHGDSCKFDHVLSGAYQGVNPIGHRRKDGSSAAHP